MENICNRRDNLPHSNLCFSHIDKTQIKKCNKNQNETRKFQFLNSKLKHGQIRVFIYLEIKVVSVIHQKRD